MASFTMKVKKWRILSCALFDAQSGRGIGGGELSLILSCDDYVLCNLQQVA